MAAFSFSSPLMIQQSDCRIPNNFLTNIFIIKAGTEIFNQRYRKKAYDEENTLLGGKKEQF